MRHLIFLIALTLATKLSFAQLIVSGEITKNIPVSKGISFIEDKEGKFTFAEIEKSKDFKPVTSDVPNFGISTSTFWLKVEIKNTTHKETYRLVVSQPSLDEIDFYQYDNKGNLKVLKGGECLPFSSREFFDPSYIYRVRLDTLNPTTVFFRIKSRDNFQVPMYVSVAEVIFETNKVKDYIFGIFAGVMVVMLLYNTFIYITVRDKTYLYYIIYLATVILTQVSIQGYTFQYLWPDSPFMAQWSPFIFSPMVGVASAYFMRIFLNSA
ncbi:MAG: hypothetical protein JNL60_15075, partial [Bacteroidia bacterium]|nr:hypothetical protein [Bacteroidia bacterium]